MAVPCGSTLLSLGFTLSPGVGQGQGGSRSLGIPGLGQGVWLTCDPAPKPADQFLVVGAEEGIYTLNLHELHEDTLEKVRPSWLWRAEGLGGPGVLTPVHLSLCGFQLISHRCTWLYCVNNVLLSLSGINGGRHGVGQAGVHPAQQHSLSPPFSLPGREIHAHLGP